MCKKGQICLEALSIVFIKLGSCGLNYIKLYLRVLEQWQFIQIHSSALERGGFGYIFYSNSTLYKTNKSILIIFMLIFYFVKSIFEIKLDITKLE